MSANGHHPKYGSRATRKLSKMGKLMDGERLKALLRAVSEKATR